MSDRVPVFAGSLYMAHKAFCLSSVSAYAVLNSLPALRPMNVNNILMLAAYMNPVMIGEAFE